jgi:hypothetical protein
MRRSSFCNRVSNPRTISIGRSQADLGVPQNPKFCVLSRRTTFPPREPWHHSQEPLLLEDGLVLESARSSAWGLHFHPPLARPLPSASRRQDSLPPILDARPAARELAHTPPPRLLIYSRRVGNGGLRAGPCLRLKHDDFNFLPLYADGRSSSCVAIMSANAMS